MKYFLFVYLVLNISLCIGQNFYSKELAFNTIDENGGSRFLNIKIDKNGIVKGVAGYECCQLGEADSWKGLILGKIKDNEINGSYKYQVEGENIDTVIKIRLFDDYAVFIEKESKEFKLNLEKTTIYTETYYKNRINVVNWNETSTMEGKLILKDLIDQESKLTLKN